ncbi:MAG: peptidylprolyl isomerase [Smithellaceae bacterium]|nr:peptidylprolyl isomerase [Smithellaceae bacterium]
MYAKQGDMVKVHYRGMLDDGTVFDSSEGSEPLEFIIGHGQVIQGFEDAVIGMDPGDTKTVKIPADHAYGPRHDEMAIDVPRNRLPENICPEIGQVFEVQGPEGATFQVAVTALTEETVCLDANHPLAGKDLTFEITLVEIN